MQGLGLVVTGTLPVFNLTEDSSDRKVGDCGCHHPGCTGTPGVGPWQGGEGAQMLGAWLRGGGHWHPWGAACSAPPPWGETRGHCHPQDLKWPWLALRVQWGQLAAVIPWGVQCPMEGCWGAGTSHPVPLRCPDPTHTSPEGEEVHLLLPHPRAGGGG